MMNNSAAKSSPDQPAERARDVDAAANGGARSPVPWIPGDDDVTVDAVRMIEQVMRARRGLGNASAADSSVVVVVDETSVLRHAAAPIGVGTTTRDVIRAILTAARPPEPVRRTHAVFGNRLAPLMQRMAADEAHETRAVLGNETSTPWATLGTPPSDR